MKFGKMLSFLSPAFGMATGQGIGKVMPYLSPAYGMLAGKGPFADMLGMGGGQQPQQQSSLPTGMFGAGGGQQMDPEMLRLLMMQRGGY